VVGEADEALEQFKNRFGDIADRTTVNFAARDEDHRQALMTRLKT